MPSTTGLDHLRRTEVGWSQARGFVAPRGVVAGHAEICPCSTRRTGALADCSELVLQAGVVGPGQCMCSPSGRVSRTVMATSARQVPAAVASRCSGTSRVSSPPEMVVVSVGCATSTYRRRAARTTAGMVAVHQEVAFRSCGGGGHTHYSDETTPCAGPGSAAPEQVRSAAAAARRPARPATGSTPGCPSYAAVAASVRSKIMSPTGATPPDTPTTW